MSTSQGSYTPATPLKIAVGTSVSTTALVGAEVDRVGPPLTNLAAGRFAFPVDKHKSKLINIVADAAGSIVPARVKLWRRILDGSGKGYTPMHAFDCQWTTATASRGVTNGAVDASLYHGSVASTSNLSLPPTSIRVLGAGLADCAQPILFDPLDADFVTVDVDSPGSKVAVLAADIDMGA